MSTGGASTAVTASGLRCSVHPARRAVDRCPVCARPRCGADVAAHGAVGCAACRERAVTAVAAPPAELWVRCVLAGLAVAFGGGWIAAQYVDTQYFATVAPGLVGLAAAWAGAAAAPGLRPRLTLAVAVAAGWIGTALSDRLVPGGQNLFLPPGHRLPPYAAVVVGVAAWRLLFGPPRARAGGDAAGSQPVRATRWK
jgi:hypothetical protein